MIRVEIARGRIPHHQTLKLPTPTTRKHRTRQRRNPGKPLQMTPRKMMTNTATRNSRNHRHQLEIPSVRPIPTPNTIGRLPGYPPHPPQLTKTKLPHLTRRSQEVHRKHPLTETRPTRVIPRRNKSRHRTTPGLPEKKNTGPEFVSARQIPNRWPPTETHQLNISPNRHVHGPQQHPALKTTRQLVTHARQPQTRMTTSLPVPVHSRELEPRVLQVRKTQRSHEPNHLEHERQTLHQLPTPGEQDSLEPTKNSFARKTQTEPRTTQHPDTPNPTPPNLCGPPLNTTP